MPDAARLHTDQVEYWNGAGGERWVSQQARHEAMLAEFGRVALERAMATAGESVIDIGCGYAATSVELAKRVGASGRVLAVDVSAPILAAARTRLAAFPYVQPLLADAAFHAFEVGAADLLFSRFGVMFFGDPTAAFVNLRAALKPSGRVVFAVWRTFDENPWMKAPYKAVCQHVPPMPRPGPGDPGPFSFADPERVAKILTAAGFRMPEFEPFDTLVDLAGGRGIEAAVEGALAVGPAARAVADQPDRVRRAAEVSVREALLPYVVGDSVKLPASIWIVRTAPAASAIGE